MKNLSTIPAFPILILASCQSPDRTAIRTVAKGDSAEHDGSAAGATVRRFHDRINFLHRQCHRAHPPCRLHALDRSDLHSQHGEVPLGYGLKTTRLTNPAAEIHKLPPLDLILLSNFHGDHFDQVAERDLNKATPIVTTQSAAEELAERGFTNIHPLETGGRSRSKKARPVFGSPPCLVSTHHD